MTQNFVVNMPLPQGQFAYQMQGNQTLIPDPTWYQFFYSLWQRTGSGSGSVSLQLDAVSNDVGATLYRGSAQWEGLPPGPQGALYQMGTQFPAWASTVSPSIFGSRLANLFCASPSGLAGDPIFRAINSADLQGTAGEYPGTATNDSAAAGNVGEYVFSQIVSGSAVVVSSGVAIDITTISLTAGDWDVWGNVVSAPAGGTTQTDIRGWVSQTSATDPGPPNNGAYVELQTTIAAGLRQVLAIPPTRISLAATTTISLSTLVTFAASTLGAYGFIGARRAR